MIKPELKEIESWAREIGQVLKGMQFEDLQTEHKSKADLVTKADKLSEAFLKGKVLQAFPDHTIMAEESGLQQGNPEHQWFIDPLDGTLNYAHGLPIYAISIAYAYKGQLQMGVIYAPNLDEMFTAEAGKGAQLNGKPIHASGTAQMIDAMLITGFRFHLLDTPRSNIDNFVNLSHLVQSVRRLGSAALDLAYVACGRVEGFWEISLFPWDAAAGILLVREAGGIAEPLYESKSLLEGSPSLLAANAALFGTIKNVLETKKY
ncbi:MAG: inositol monophosphatase family protein [Anaerolineaceae bacterium]|nr:inositol monophosphatase family protein [Anaerolineaceae bacterium]